MNKVNEFTRPSLKHLRLNLDAELEKIGKKFGIDMRLGSCSFSPDNATFKLEMKVEGGMTKGQHHLELFTKFKLNDKVFVSDLGLCTVVDYKHRNTKYPLIVKTVRNKQYKIAVRHAIAADSVNA